jgi:hypothetical protein
MPVGDIMVELGRKKIYEVTYIKTGCTGFQLMMVSFKCIEWCRS